jgi:hypothetical protein
MPRQMTPTTSESISFEDFTEYARRGVDVGTSDGLWKLADCFAMLGNNREFLSNFYIEYIKGKVSKDVFSTVISQAVVLYRCDSFYVRANFWLPMDQVSPDEARLFAYDQPHDHNFDLLSLSYCGDGYVSDGFEYDYDSTIGYIGEEVDLKPLGPHKHALGDVLMYVCSKDIHVQNPPETPSITLSDPARESERPSRSVLLRYRPPNGDEGGDREASGQHRRAAPSNVSHRKATRERRDDWGVHRHCQESHGSQGEIRSGKNRRRVRRGRSQGLGIRTA